METFEFIWLLFAHYIGDIALQTQWQSDNKGKLWYVLFSHSMIWTACICVALAYIGKFDYIDVPILVFGHMACDHIKSNLPRTPATWWYIYPDQIFHILQITAVYLISW